MEVAAVSMIFHSITIPFHSADVFIHITLTHSYINVQKMSYRISRQHFQILKKSWLAFVRDEKRKEGETGYLPSGRNMLTACHCGKSKTSFPHWPPSTYEEAEQLRCLLGESFPHRLYLGHCWIISLRQKLATVREPSSQRNHEWIIHLVEENREIEKYNGGEALGSMACKVNCKTVCEPILQANNCYCLCCCARHREECPVHHLTP